MQVLKHKFNTPDLSRYSSIQSCLRTVDLELVGDGSHLTYFEMIGSFSFGNNDYLNSIDMWDMIIKNLKIPVSHVTVHPTQTLHKNQWIKQGYDVKFDDECTWSDGTIGGYCCELFVGDLEIGNLVNPLGHSVDVGFGFERLVQVVENKSRVDDTTIFNQTWHPIVRDHVRSVQKLIDQDIYPGGKGRSSVCRKLVRRMIPYIGNSVLPTKIQELVDSEINLIHKKTNLLNKFKNVFDTKPHHYWYETYGLTREEIEDFLEKH